ncbi:MAG: LysR family transcriptional regulator [Gammaproteobacteria bacterium]|nr:LysR family transcriptional regulator [Gammaproteobacteria bacterium]
MKTHHGWIRRVKLQQLRTVLAVADHDSLLQAANALGLSQPAVTKALHELESELGVELFVRTSRGTYPTEYGRLLAARARIIFSQLARASDELFDLRDGFSGHVRVGTLIAGAASLLPMAIVALQQTYPGIRVLVTEGTYEQLVPQLRQGTLDLLLGRLPAHRYREELDVEPLYQERVEFVVRPEHPSLAMEAPALESLRAWPWILPPPDTTLRQMLEAAFHDANLDLPEAMCESMSVVSNRQLILHSNVIGAFPAQVLAPDIASGMLAAVRLARPLTFGPVGISTLRGVMPGNAVGALIDAVRRAVANVQISQV